MDRGVICHSDRRSRGFTPGDTAAASAAEETTIETKKEPTTLDKVGEERFDRSRSLYFLKAETAIDREAVLCIDAESFCRVGGHLSKYSAAPAF